MITSVNSPDFIKVFDDSLGKLQRLLDKYVEKGDPDSIHDVRTSIRRLRAAYCAIPAAGKTRSSARFMKKLRKFFRKNSLTRDCDVIRDRLLARQLSQDSALLETLEIRRKRQLQKTMTLAIELSGLQGPRFKSVDDDMMVTFERQARKLIEMFLRYLPLVLKDAARAADIHTLRKTAKKLFYLLELHEESAELRKMMHLKKLQRLSGDICDCDVTIEFLKENEPDSNTVQELLREEQQLRDNLYQEMAEFLKGVNWERLLKIQCS